MNFPNHQHPVEDLSNSGAVGREIVRSDTATEVIDIILRDPLDVAHGGTGVDTFTQGVVTANGTDPLSTVTGTTGQLVKWDANTLANSILSETASGRLIQDGIAFWASPDTAYNASPVFRFDFNGLYDSSGTRTAMVRQEFGKFNSSDGDQGGYYSLKVKTSGGSLTERIGVDSSGTVTMSSLTGNKFVKTNGASSLTSADITPGDITGAAALTKTDDTNVTLTLGGTPSTALLQATSLALGWTGQLSVARGGTGASTANGALTNLLPSQTGNAGKVLSTDGSVTSWISAGSAGTVTSVAVSSSDVSVSGSPITTSGTISLSLNTVPIAKGGTGQTTANAALNALLPSQASNAGKVLSTDGTNTSWISSGSAGTVTSVAVSSTDLSVSGSPITAAGTITLDINSGAVSLAKMANLATQQFIGRNTSGTGTPESLSMSTARTMLSINNVENTALSTWAGSTNLTTLGTITTGTWSGTAIATSKGGTGATTANDGLNNLLPSQASNAGKVLSTDGTNTAWISAGGVGTVTSVGLTSSDLTVGGASSPITASGTYTLTLNTVPISKGGTGQTTASAAINALVPTQTGNAGKVLTTDGSAVSWGSVGGVGTVTSVGISSSDLSVSGSPVTSSGTITLTLSTVPVSKGGTGQTTATAAFDALSPTSSLGDLSYRGASNNVRLAGNTTTTRKYLRQTGDGTYSAAPAWDTILASDIPPSGLSTSNADANLRLTLGGYYATSLLASSTIDATWTGQLSIARGGTGQSTKSTAFNALSPTTSAGSIIYHNGTTNTELAIGSSGQVLTVSGGNPSWQTPTSSVTATNSFVQTGSADYTLLDGTFHDVVFGGSDFKITLPSTGTYLVTALLEITGSPDDQTIYAQFTKGGSAVSNSERRIQRFGTSNGNPQQLVLQNLVSTTGSSVINVQAYVSAAGYSHKIGYERSTVSYIKIAS